MFKWERVLTAVGALSGILVAVDQYVLKSKLADALLVPVGIPVGGIALLVVVFLIAVLVVRFFRRPSTVSSLAVQPVRDETLVSELTLCRAEKAALENQLKSMKSRLDRLSSLRIKVIAVLASKEASPYEILREIRLDPNDANNMQDLLDTIGVLVQEGLVGRGSISSYYKLCSQPSVGQSAGQGNTVCYRDMIKLVHKSTGHALHSHNIGYSHPGTSGQQQVTAFAGSDSNDYWKENRDSAHFS